MPLISLCGGPLTGKTKVTEAIVAYVKQNYPDVEIQVINFESLKINRNVAYQDMTNEKKLNGILRTAVERTLTMKRLVILDAPNLIKGFRYELFTRVRAIPTVSCVVFCDTPYEVTHARNQELKVYQERLFEDLWNRLEEPLATFRWDAPLFTVKPGDAVPVKAIVEAVLHSKATSLSLPNTARALEAGDYVFALDKVTQSVVRQVVEAQREAGYGVGGLSVWGTLTVAVKVGAGEREEEGEGVGAGDAVATDAASASPTAATTGTATTSADSTSAGGARGGAEADSAIAGAEAAVNAEAGAGAGVEAAPVSSGFKLMRKAIKPRVGTTTAPTSVGTTTAPTSGNPDTNTNTSTTSAANATTNVPPTSTTTSSTASTSTSTLTLLLSKPVSPAALLDLRRAFTRTAVMLSLQGADAIARAFVEFLQPRV